jgi:hypothetical protein
VSRALVLPAFICTLVCTAQEPTAEAILARCLEALGGRERIQGIRGLRVTWRALDGQSLLVQDVQRPRLIRKEIPGRDWKAVYDGARVCLWGEYPLGADPGPKLLKDPEEPRDWDIDIALLFPAIFDYPCTYEGLEELDGIRAHRLRVLSPSGVALTYFVDAGSFLPVRLHMRFSRRGTTYNNQRIFSDFREVGGIRYPYAITGVTPTRRYTYRVESVVLNPTFPADHFRIPESAQPEVEISPETQAALLVDRCAQALGGRERLAALRTLRVTSVYAEHPRPVVQEWRRPTGVHVAGTAFYFDGQRAWKEGPGEAPPILMDPEFLQHCELDAAFLFPALFDFPVRYEGGEAVEGRPAHKLSLTLPRGARLTYFLDYRTYLPLRAVGGSTSQGQAYKPERTYADFQATDGILFPRRFTFSTPKGPREGQVERVEVNVDLPSLPK